MPPLFSRSSGSIAQLNGRQKEVEHERQPEIVKLLNEALRKELTGNQSIFYSLEDVQELGLRGLPTWLEKISPLKR